jgi:hypothetical protein
LHLGHPPRTTSRIDPRSRKRLALLIALVLSSGAFVLVAGEARAQQQPKAPHHQQQKQQEQPEKAKQVVPASATPPGVEEPPAAAGKGVAEPVDQAVTVASPKAVTSPPPKPAAEKTSRTSLSGEPKKPATEKPGATKPGAALPEDPPARVPVRAEPRPEPEPGPERDHAPIGLDPTPTTPVSVSAPISAPASKPAPETAPEPVAPERGDPLRTSAQGEAADAARGLGPATLSPEEDFFSSGSTPLPEQSSSADDPAAAPTGPVLEPYSSSPSTDVPVGAVERGAGGLARVPPGFETAANTVGSAVGSAMEAARSATTSAAAEVLQTLANGALDPSSYSSDGAQASPTQEEGGTTHPPSQPAAPLLPPVGDGPLFSSSGTGQAGFGSGFVMLLLGVLASGLVFLLRRDGLLFLASWEIPRPTSALLLPLERPG